MKIGNIMRIPAVGKKYRNELDYKMYLIDLLSLNSEQLKDTETMSYREFMEQRVKDGD